MKKEIEKLGMLTEEISDEGVDFSQFQTDDEEEDVLHSVEDPKIQESLSSVNSDDSVKIYLQQIGKIPLLSSEQELLLTRFTKNKASLQKICLLTQTSDLL